MLENVSGVRETFLYWDNHQTAPKSLTAWKNIGRNPRDVWQRYAGKQLRTGSARRRAFLPLLDLTGLAQPVARMRHQPQKKPRRRPAGKQVPGPPPPSCDVRLAAHGCCESERSHSQTDFTCGAHTLCALVVELAPSRQETVTSECDNGCSALFCGLRLHFGCCAALLQAR